MFRTHRHARRILAILAVSIASFALAPSAGAVSTIEKQDAWRVNHERWLRHERQLKVSESLSNLARQHSCDMARSETLYHNANLPNEVSGWQVLGENVGMSWDMYEVHKAFMASQEHRDNILDRSYRLLGTGVCRSSDGTFWVTNIFFG